jgi:hypothetical protein
MPIVPCRPALHYNVANFRRDLIDTINKTYGAGARLHQRPDRLPHAPPKHKKWHPLHLWMPFTEQVIYRSNFPCFTPRMKLCHWLGETTKLALLRFFESRTATCAEIGATSTQVPELSFPLRELLRHTTLARLGLVTNLFPP